MIILKFKNSNHEFKYKGNIELSCDDVFIWVHAFIYKDDTIMDFEISDLNVYDAFWIEDIESITGL